MRMSDPKKAELYNSISEPIMKRRIGIARINRKSVGANTVDEMLFALEQEIWRGLKKTLNINE
jgi:hypothetical protein